MTLRALHIANFKPFARAQRVPLRPITLLYGANGAGKSAILHAFTLLHRAAKRQGPRQGPNAPATAPVGLGAFREHVHRHERDRRVELRFELDPGCLGEQARRGLRGLRRIVTSVAIGEHPGAQSSDPLGDPLPEGASAARCRIERFSVHADDARILSMGANTQGTLTLQHLEHRHPLLHVLRQRDRVDATDASAGDAPREELPRVHATMDRLFPRLERPAPRTDTWAKGRDPGTPLTKALHELIETLAGATEHEIRRFAHLGTLSHHPGRDPTPPLACAADPWPVLEADHDLRERVDAWLGAPGRLPIPHALERARLVATGCESTTPAARGAMGTGMQQLLPLLTCAHACTNRILAVEHPETHLHPRLHGEIGDLLIDSALGRNANTLLIETHSEHLLLRIMRRMRETHRHRLAQHIPAVRPEHVAVLLVERDAAQSLIREMPLNECGALVKAWPGGFFEEALHEMS